MSSLFRQQKMETFDPVTLANEVKHIKHQIALLVPEGQTISNCGPNWILVGYYL
jgi:hypothetical protein